MQQHSADAGLYRPGQNRCSSFAETDSLSVLSDCADPCCVCRVQAASSSHFDKSFIEVGCSLSRGLKAAAAPSRVCCKAFTILQDAAFHMRKCHPDTACNLCVWLTGHVSFMPALDPPVAAASAGRLALHIRPAALGVASRGRSEKKRKGK